MRSDAVFPAGLESRAVACPCCGETIELLADGSVGSQEYVEDCEVCCRPITVSIEVDRDGELALSVRDQDQ